MKHILAIRHVAFEHLGTLAPVCNQLGFQITYLDIGFNDLKILDPLAPDLLVVLGGPIGAYEDNKYPWLLDELHCIEQRLAAKRPILGICLGAQLMARALGGKVYPNNATEIGWSPLRLTPAGENSCLKDLATCDFQVLHWHGDTYDLPIDTQCLASTDITKNQAFSYGKTALGLQFHLEIDVTEIERWLIGHAHEIAATPSITNTHLRTDSAYYGNALAASAANCLKNWLTHAIEQ
ncbi:glutamine amidotransferase [Achromatium sp. WMS3]|nr:glutamine amidotransferase [Achromatium sp. WMS3]